MQPVGSYVHGAGSAPLVGDTVGRLLDRTVREHDEELALVVRHQGIRWSWRQLAARVDAVAAGLLEAGLEPGDRIALLAPNCGEWIVAQFASAQAGLILVNVNPAYRLPELEYALRSVGCRALITAGSFKTSRYIDMLQELLPELSSKADGDRLESARLPDLESVILIGSDEARGMRPFDDLLQPSATARARLEAVRPQLQFDDAINIQFTSGTTGTPKAATLSHHNIVNNALLTGARMRLGPQDRLCIPVPLYHCFGMVLGTLCCVAHGATMVLPAAGFDAEATLEAIDAERCTAVHGVPTMFIAELEHPDFDRFDLSSLRTGIIAGAPCPVELMKRLIESMHLGEITIAYGMTETGPVSFQTSPEDSLERRVETVGQVLPYTEVKIVDELDRVVPRGTAGELLTRGYCVMRGYWGDAERTAESFDAGRFLRSGDIAVLDSDGYCRIVGRTKDMLIRGGENIFPREIEECLYQHPAVEEAEVFGVPDRRYGEEVCAWIQLRQGVEASEEEIRDFCRPRLAHFKVPRYIRFVSEFPMTVTGKVQKFKMREQMAEELGLLAVKARSA